MEIIDTNTWKRKEHFQHFRKFDEPFFGIVAQIDCTIAYNLTKKKGHSFFAWYLHRSLMVANQIEEFRTRILNGKVVLFDTVHASATMGREDGTFGLSFTEFTPDFSKFEKSLKNEAEEVNNSIGLRLRKDEIRLDLIHYSSFPWKHFTGLTHAREFKSGDSVPKITFGKFFYQNKQKIMAVSVNVHHGLADGYHVARFFELFQELMNRD